jgi:hypothetical protein
MLTLVAACHVNDAGSIVKATHVVDARLEQDAPNQRSILTFIFDESLPPSHLFYPSVTPIDHQVAVQCDIGEDDRSIVVIWANPNRDFDTGFHVTLAVDIDY